MATEGTTGNEWEDHIHDLLRIHHGPSNYQPVPAQHCGDFGIDSYSFSGEAYQCYSPQVAATTNALYIKLRDKVTQDIGKFVKNSTELATLFQNNPVRRWILVTPHNPSAKLLQHLSTKTAEILQAGLPYVTSDFQAVVLIEDDFKAELRSLVYNAVAQLQVPVNDPAMPQLDGWMIESGNSSRLENLKKKVAFLAENESDGKLDELQRDAIRAYLRLKEIEEWLKNDFPDIWDRVVMCIQTRENGMQMRYLAQPSNPGEALTNEIDGLQHEIDLALSHMDKPSRTALVSGQASNWLMTCFLTFPGVN